MDFEEDARLDSSLASIDGLRTLAWKPSRGALPPRDSTTPTDSDPDTRRLAHRRSHSLELRRTEATSPLTWSIAARPHASDSRAS